MPHVVRRSPAVRLTRPVALATLLGALALSGCGGEEKANGPIVNPSKFDLTPTARVELARGVYKDNDPGAPFDPVVSEKESRCIADALLKRFDVDGLIEIGVLNNAGIYRAQPMGIPAEQAQKWLASFEGCLDIKTYALAVARAGVREIAPEAGADDAAWDDARRCLDGADPKAAPGVVLQSLTAKEGKDAATQAFVDCVKVAYPVATL